MSVTSNFTLFHISGIIKNMNDLTESFSDDAQITEVVSMVHTCCRHILWIIDPIDQYNQYDSMDHFIRHSGGSNPRNVRLLL